MLPFCKCEKTSLYTRSPIDCFLRGQPLHASEGTEGGRHREGKKAAATIFFAACQRSNRGRGPAIRLHGTAGTGTSREAEVSTSTHSSTAGHPTPALTAHSRLTRSVTAVTHSCLTGVTFSVFLSLIIVILLY